MHQSMLDLIKLKGWQANEYESRMNGQNNTSYAIDPDIFIFCLPPAHTTAGSCMIIYYAPSVNLGFRGHDDPRSMMSQKENGVDTL
jgi:hypothetical protein